MRKFIHTFEDDRFVEVIQTATKTHAFYQGRRLCLWQNRYSLDRAERQWHRSVEGARTGASNAGGPKAFQIAVFAAIEALSP